MKKFILLFILSVSLFSQTITRFNLDGMSLKLQKLLSLENVVWAMDFISKDELIVTLKNGNIVTYDLKSKNLRYLKNIPFVVNKGQGGLLDVAVSPNFKKDNTIYFTYVKQHGIEVVTTLARAKYRYNDLYAWEDLLVSKSNSNTFRHFGSRIAFDKKGHLYFSIGDRGIRANGQNLRSHAGSIIRLNLDGSVPLDNPFVNDKNKLDEIYSFGHRNPQGLFYDKNRDILFSCEHGPRGGDEINIIKKGVNYGWPTISYGKEYSSPMAVGEGTHKAGMEQPIKVYIPSIAPSSLLVYDGDKFPKFKGNLFIGALKLTHLNRIILDDNLKVVKEERLFENLHERIRDVIQSPDELIYISTDSGNIYRIIPN